MSFRKQTAALPLAALLPALVLSAPALGAQEIAEPAEPLAVGTEAPDFALVGADAEGVLEDSIGPSDFAGHTLVIAFFFRARSSG